jgi:hypothetical protein
MGQENTSALGYQSIDEANPLLNWMFEEDHFSLNIDRADDPSYPSLSYTHKIPLLQYVVQPPKHTPMPFFEILPFLLWHALRHHV